MQTLKNLTKLNKLFLKKNSTLIYQAQGFQYSSAAQLAFDQLHKEYEENPYKYLQVKRKLNFIQHSELLMNLTQEQLRQCTPEETANHYMVKNFFPQFAEQIQTYNSNDLDLSQESNNINFPRNAFNKIVLPLSKNEKMRNKFQRFYSDSIRIGVLMELLDYQAVIASYNYIYNKREEATFVTGSVDNINFYKRLESTKDLIIQSYPAYVGKSSLEIGIDIFQEVEGENGEIQEELRASASFVMVARQKADHTKSYQLPKLQFKGEPNAERALMRQAIGEKKQQTRKSTSQESLTIKPPTSEEIQYVHKYHLYKEQLINNEQWIQIKETQLSKNLLMHMQDRNLHGKIFGGFLMREAFEIGWLAAYQHAQGTYPEIYHVDDFQFFSPVTIGDILEFKSRVSYVKGDLLHVYVEVQKRDLSGKIIKTNDLQLTFLISDKNMEKSLRKVYPESYEEAMIQCDSRRRLAELI